jgi:hypothetical protein
MLNHSDITSGGGDQSVAASVVHSHLSVYVFNFIEHFLVNRGINQAVLNVLAAVGLVNDYLLRLAVLLDNRIGERRVLFRGTLLRVVDTL